MKIVILHQLFGIVMQEGDLSIDFELYDNNGDKVSLNSFRGKKIVVLCFYPKNHLFACPSKLVFKNARSIISVYEQFFALDSILFAISVDTIEDQKKFVDEYKIPYSHLSDPKKIACRLYAGLNMAGLAKRSTFIIDKKGKVVKIFRDINVDSHGPEIVSFLKNM